MTTIVTAAGGATATGAAALGNLTKAELDVAVSDGDALYVGDVTDATIPTTDITANNATTSKHGFLDKLPGGTTLFKRADGAWAAPTTSAIPSDSLVEAFSAQTSVTVVHNWGANPLVEVLVGNRKFVPLDVWYTEADLVTASVNQFIVKFTESTSGLVVAQLGSPAVRSVTSVSANYSVLSSDFDINVTVSELTITMPDATLEVNKNKNFRILCPLVGTVTVNTTSSQTINGLLTAIGANGDVLVLVAIDGNWRIETILSTQIAALANSVGFKNKIIGGDFTVNPWQRGTSFAAISNEYCADRWKAADTSNAVITASRSTSAPTAAQAGICTKHSLRLIVTTADASIAAGDYSEILQRMEGLNTVSFGFGQAGSRSVTLSFWVMATVTGIYCVSIRNDLPVDRSYVAEYTINAANTWEYKTITIPVTASGVWQYDTGIGLNFSFTLAAGTTYQTAANTWTTGNFLATANQVNVLASINNYFAVALVQLESGSSATPFDVRSVGEELALCQRYYQTHGLQVPDNTTPASHRIDMRAIPTVTGGGTGFSSVNTTSGNLIYSKTTTSYQSAIKLSAEL